MPEKEASQYMPPASKESEQACLGSILVRPELMDEAVELLRPQDFYTTAHQKIFSAMVDLYQADEAVDLVTVTFYLKDRGQLENCGGAVYLAGLSEATGFATNFSHYGKIVKNKAILRRLLDASQEIASACLAPVENIEEFVGQAEIKISERHGGPGHPGIFLGRTRTGRNPAH